MKKTASRQLGETIHGELDIDKNLSTRGEKTFSRSDSRRAIEDLLVVKRYQEMHEDIHDC